MSTVGSNVVSMLGFQITEVPEFPDKRGPVITFQSHLRGGKEDVIEVRGTRTVFGLALHRSLNGAGWVRWVVSEPNTGGAVAWGRTRQGTLDDLALRVAHFGGEAAFQRVIDDAVSRHSAKRKLAAPSYLHIDGDTA